MIHDRRIRDLIPEKDYHLCKTCAKIGERNPIYGLFGENNPNFGQTRESIKGDKNPSKRPEVREKISFSKKGTKNFLGKKHTEESKQKTSAKLKGRISPNKGKKHPELCGNGNPNANLTVFCFRNIKSGETFVGNQHDFSQKFNLNISAINPMIHGRHKTSQGWTIH